MGGQEPGGGSAAAPGGDAAGGRRYGGIWPVGGPDLPEPSRLRLALEVLADLLPVHLDRPLLQDLEQKVAAEEKQHLEETGLARQYLIIRPLNLLSPPGPEDMAAITSAIATLARLGMLASQGDDE